MSVVLSAPACVTLVVLPSCVKLFHVFDTHLKRNKQHFVGAHYACETFYDACFMRFAITHTYNALRERMAYKIISISAVTHLYQLFVYLYYLS